MPRRIEGTPIPEGPQRTRQSDPRRPPENTAAKDTIGATDSVELFDTAALQSAARDLPDIREDRIAQARARIAAGEYDSENVRRVIADRILDQFGIE